MVGPPPFIQKLLLTVRVLSYEFEHFRDIN